MIVINATVEGIEKLRELTNRLYDLDFEIKNIVMDELDIFVDMVKQTPGIDETYRDSITYVVVPNDDRIVLFVNKTEERWQANRTPRDTESGATRFGTKVEWAMYTCPKRKYAGGKLALEYTGPDYIKEQWAIYKNTFINKVKQRISELIRGM